jgi:hypothetical protein
MNHDETFEDGYAWQYGGVVEPNYGAFAEGFSGEGMVSHADFYFSQTGAQAGETADVYVWSSDGENPSNVLAYLPDWDPGPIGVWPTVTQHSITVLVPVSGEYFVGFWGNWPNQPPGWYVAGDSDGPGGTSRTKFAPGIGYPTGWGDPNHVPHWNVSSLGIGNELFHEMVCFENSDDTMGGVYAGGFTWMFEATYVDPITPYFPELMKNRGPILLNPPGKPDMHSRVAVDSDDHMHLAWMRQKPDDHWEVYYAELDSDGQLISGPIQISDVDATTSAYPAIALDSADDAHVVWIDGRSEDSDEIYYSKVDDGQDATRPDYRVSDLLADSGRLIMPPTDIGGSNSEIEHPDIAVDSDDYVHVVWSDHRLNSWRVFYQKQPNVSQPNPVIDDTRISANLQGGETYAPAMAIDGVDNVHIAWRDSRDGSGSEIYYQKQKPDGEVLVDDLRVSAVDGELSSMPDIAVGPGGVVIAYMDKGADPGEIGGEGGHPDGQWEIFLRTMDIGGNPKELKRQSDVASTSAHPEWGEYTSPDSNSMYPQVAKSGENIHLTWHDYRDDQENAEIYYTLLQSTCISPAPDCRVTSTAVKDMYPAVALHNDNNPTITYQAERVSSWEIYRSSKNTDEWVRLLVSGSSGTGQLDMFRQPARNGDFDNEYFLSINLPSGEYTYSMAAQDSLGNYYETDAVPLIVSSSGVEDVVPEPRMWLAQNDPNPFSGTTTISYTLPEEAHVELNIYDLAGRRVRNLVDGFQKPGRLVVQWDGRNGAGQEVGNGLYLCKLRAAGREFTRKITVVR